MTFNEKVIEIAERDIGMEEIRGNRGWKDKLFEKAMRAIGWQRGWAWCASWVRKVYLQAAEELWGKESDNYRHLQKTMSHGVVRAARKMTASPYFTATAEPSPGCVACLSHGGGKGHEYIIYKRLPNFKVKTIEGNTNKKGEREGTVVRVNERAVEPYNLIDTYKFIPKEEPLLGK